MSFEDVKYVIRFFKDDKYLYSIHCSKECLDDLTEKAKQAGETVKIVAYKDSKED